MTYLKILVFVLLATTSFADYETEQQKASKAMITEFIGLTITAEITYMHSHDRLEKNRAWGQVDKSWDDIVSLAPAGKKDICNQALLPLHDKVIGVTHEKATQREQDEAKKTAVEACKP